MQITFKIHRIEQRNFADGICREERWTLHPIDQHEAGQRDHGEESTSGSGKFVLHVTKRSQIGTRKVGDFVTVSII